MATMRDVLIENIYHRMKIDDNIFFLTADFGSPKLDLIRKDFPNNFLNVGIAEANLINISTGLALEGFTVYAYAISAFLTMRGFEQIRNNLSLMSQFKDLNVNMIGVGTGLSYDMSGPSHHCLEDISVMRTLPNIQIFSPSDNNLVKKFVDYSINYKNPKYIRLDGKPLSNIYDNIDFKIEDGFCEFKKGEDICIVSTGYMTHTAIESVDILADKNNVGIIDIFMLKPLDEYLFYEKIKDYKTIITMEEGFINKGGLDSLVSYILDRKNSNIKLKRIGFEDRYVFDIGSRDYLHRLNKLDKDSIIRTIKTIKDEQDRDN